MRAALVLALLLGHGGVAVRRRATDELPQDFIVGAGTSAYQSEGAWNLQMYRFSLSWPRLLPTGHRSSLNPDGIRYYTDLLNELHSSGIKPMV
ncbi:hypothetical protein FOCC_FOCC015999, partial [Frankliniella occidentalis]